jgi:UDP-2,3-diacylglucosamine pyrophosphatase LpxH
MPTTNRRRVMAGAASAAALASLPIQLRAQARGRNRIVLVSDVHIGDGSPTVWYQPRLHEPYLLALLDHVQDQAGEIAELVILGDFVDFWTYPPGRRPPSFAEIAAANPRVFGPDGSLPRLIDALDGRVTYVPGNHDGGITQIDLDLVRSPNGRTIRLHRDPVYVPQTAGPRLAFAHGHHWTMFNAPYPGTRFGSLPPGHFVTRAFSHYLETILRPGQSVADLPDQGEPNGLSLASLVRSVDRSFVDTALNYVARVTGMPQDQPIILPSGQTATLAEARAAYAGLWADWAARGGGGLDGELEAAKAALADANGTYLSWFAQRMGLRHEAQLVVFGHTHAPISGLKQGFIDYMNTGFDCPSAPDIGRKHPTFMEVETASGKGRLKQVRAVGGRYEVADFDEAPRDSIVYGPTFDFSTYVTIDNRQGRSDLVRTALAAEDGRYVVEPPVTVKAGSMARFWIQDRPGPVGSRGSVSYRASDGREIALSFACPTGLAANTASGAPFRSRTGDDPWGAPDQAARRGHPFFVEFRT